MRIANCKLSYQIINRIMQPKIPLNDPSGNTIEVNNITGTELDLLVFMSIRQNPWGKVTGIYYKDACLELGYSCKQTFYNAIHGLEYKEYIAINYNIHDEYWECTILNNVFDNDEDDKKGYFNTNRAFLHSPEFRNLKLNEKKICIYLAMSYQESHWKQYGLKIYPETIAKKIGLITTSLVYSYMENINKFFPNKREKSNSNGEIFVLPKGNFIPFDCKQKTEREHFLTHKFTYFCRIFKISYTLKDLKDLIILIGQYAVVGIGILYGTICDVLLRYRSIQPALINRLLSERRGRAGFLT